MDSGWIKALELPTKITGGVFAASVVIYLLDRSDQLALAEIGAWVSPVVIITGVLSGCLFVASVLSSLGGAGVRIWENSRARKSRLEAEARALAHLDQLSEQELYMVCEAIREGSPSFHSWAYISGGGQLTAKGLLYSPEGTFNTEHWPFTFNDFAWKEIERRKDEFLQKEKNAKAAKEAAKRRRR